MLLYLARVSGSIYVADEYTPFENKVELFGWSWGQHNFWETTRSLPMIINYQGGYKLDFIHQANVSKCKQSKTHFCKDTINMSWCLKRETLSKRRINSERNYYCVYVSLPCALLANKSMWWKTMSFSNQTSSFSIPHMMRFSARVIEYSECGCSHSNGEIHCSNEK